MNTHVQVYLLLVCSMCTVYTTSVPVHLYTGIIKIKVYLLLKFEVEVHCLHTTPHNELKNIEYRYLCVPGGITCYFFFFKSFTSLHAHSTAQRMRRYTSWCTCVPGTTCHIECTIDGNKSRCTSHIWSIFIDAKSTENLSFCFFQSNRIPSQSINKKSYGFKDQQCGHDPTP